MSNKKSKKKRKYKTVSRRIVAGELDLKYPYNAGCARDSGHRQRAERGEAGPGRTIESPFARRDERDGTNRRRRRALAERPPKRADDRKKAKLCSLSGSPEGGGDEYKSFSRRPEDTRKDINRYNYQHRTPGKAMFWGGGRRIPTPPKTTLRAPRRARKRAGGGERWVGGWSEPPLSQRTK